MMKRRIISIYWAAAVMFIPEAAFAYIDPATTTYLIQIATAVIVMAGVSLTVFLYRFRTISAKVKYWLYGVLYRSGLLRSARNDESKASDNIQENKPFVMPPYAMSGDETPPDISSFDESVRTSLSNSKDDECLKKKEKSVVSLISYTGRMRIMIPLAIAFGFTFVIIGCLELTIRHAPEIPFGVTTILPTVILVFVVLILVLIFAVPTIRGRAFEILISIGFSILIAGYIQGNFLNTGLGQLTGDAVVWSDLRPQIAISLICWCACFFIVLFLWKRFRKAWRTGLLVVPLLLILLQSVSLISVINDNVNESKASGGPLWTGTGEFWKAANEALTIEGINEISEKKNAVIFVLDRLDQEFVEEISEEDASFFEALDGFTEFDDFINWYGSTFPSVVSFLTGIRYQYDMQKNDFFTYAWSNAEFLHNLQQQGVDIRLYMDRGFSFNYISQLGGLASNTFEGELGINNRIALVKLLKLSGYRYAPMPVKEIFWFSPTEFIDSIELTDKTFPYITDDIRYYEALVAEGLNSVDDDGAFKYIHLLGPHPPFNMDENAQYVEESDFIRQTKGSFRIVYEYIDQMKALGLYEDSMIIIMGDHGNYLGDELTRPARTALFVKPAGSAGTPLDISHAPVSPEQLHATIMESLFGDTGGFGKTFFDMNEGDDVVREYVINLSRYQIVGDGRDFDNWEFVGLFPNTYR